MNDVVISDAAGEINRLHAGIFDGMKKTVQDAIRIGDILQQVKERLEHGHFMSWVRANCDFSQDTARNYMKLSQYQDKFGSVRNLQEAYQITERLEAHAKKTEHQQAVNRAEHYNKTGVKLEGWRRETDDSLASRLKESEEKVAQEIRRKEDLAEKNRKERIEWQEDIDRTFDELRRNQEALAKHSEERTKFKERIRVSFEGMKDSFVDALMDYLEGLDDDQRRIETCYNIIKVCRGIAVELQRNGT